jgi:uncharacterized membrane protein
VTEGEEVDVPRKHSPPASAHDQHTKRVLAGYKATLRSTFLAFAARGWFLGAWLICLDR